MVQCLMPASTSAASTEEEDGEGSMSNGKAPGATCS